MDTLSLFRRDDEDDTSGCTLHTCQLSDSYYAYRPSLPTNATFLALFTLSLCGYLFQAVLSRRFIGFSIAMVSGCVLEMVGYVGRVKSYHDPFEQTGFLMQIICLTIAPAFLAAAIYLTLSRIVISFGPQNSLLSPQLYPRLFIPFDVISLLLQAMGGGMASGAAHSGKSPDAGNHIMVAGLAFQVFTLLVFQILCVDFGVRTLRRMRKMGDAALDPTHKVLRGSWKFRGFLVAMGLSTFCIFIRSIYRVAELSEGWEGDLIQNQRLFIGFEGAMVVVAVWVLNVWHPGFCFREGYVRGERGKGVGLLRRRDGSERAKNGEETEKETVDEKG